MPGVSVGPIKHLDDGRAVRTYQLRGESGLSIDVIDLGATITSIKTADRSGELDDITLGYDEPQDYLNGGLYFGAIAGRYCNRIAGGAFDLDGRAQSVSRNEGENHLHGGHNGFHTRVWRSQIVGDSAVSFSLVSPDGDEGFPGTVRVEVVYRIEEPDTLRVSYQAMTDRPTVINLTQHSYFNLAGHAQGSALDHRLHIAAPRYATVGDDMLPTGVLPDVKGTPFDFRQPSVIGDRMGMPDDQLSVAGGFDHSWALAPDSEIAAILYEPRSGRELRVCTDQPALHFYAGNHIPAGTMGKFGACYGPGAGLCLETQHFADSPNQPLFPSTRLDADEPFRSETRYCFRVRP